MFSLSLFFFFARYSQSTFHRARIYARSLYASLESYKCTYYMVKTDCFIFFFFSSYIFVMILLREQKISLAHRMASVTKHPQPMTKKPPRGFSPFCAFLSIMLLVAVYVRVVLSITLSSIRILKYHSIISIDDFQFQMCHSLSVQFQMSPN